jgi:hypothetical protein
MNPLGLGSARVLAARSGPTRRVKTPPIALPERGSSTPRSSSTHDCGDDFGYAKFTQIAPPNDIRVQCNMNFFSSSRKIFAPV